MYITIKLHSDENPLKKNSKVIVRTENLTGLNQELQTKLVLLNFLIMKEAYEQPELDLKENNSKEE